MIDDFDDYIDEQREFICTKASWDIEDASFLMTAFYVEDGSNGENDRRQSRYRELLRSCVIAKILQPDFEGEYFKPETIVRWAIEREIFREGAFSDILEKSNIETAVIEDSSQNDDEEIKSFIQGVISDYPDATSKDIVSHCFGCCKGNRKRAQIKKIIEELGIKMDKKGGRPSQASIEYMKGAPKY